MVCKPVMKKQNKTKQNKNLIMNTIKIVYKCNQAKYWQKPAVLEYQRKLHKEIATHSWQPM